MKNVKNAHMGTHLLVEVYNVPFDKLNDAKKIEQVCVDACKIEGVQVLNTYTHQFDPSGVTCTLTLVKVTFLVTLGQKKGVLPLIFLPVEQKIHVVLPFGYLNTSIVMIM